MHSNSDSSSPEDRSDAAQNDSSVASSAAAQNIQLKRIRIGEVDLNLVAENKKRVEWIGQLELIDQILACWTTITEDDLPLCPRLIGKPGMGKTTLAQAAGQELGRPVYIFQCTMDTRPEDLLVSPVLSGDGQISYHASALVTAMLTGGVAILDEANRMSEKSWASLAPLLDNRRYVDSVIAGVRIESHPDFRCCITMNDDASTYEIPEYIISRIQPMIALEYPDLEEEMAILQYNVNFAPQNLVELCAEFLQTSHKHKLDYSTRDGINIMRYCLKLESRFGGEITTCFEQAAKQVLGEDALDFESKARGALIQDNMVDFNSFFGWPPEELDDEDDLDADDNDGFSPGGGSRGDSGPAS